MTKTKSAIILLSLTIIVCGDGNLSAKHHPRNNHVTEGVLYGFESLNPLSNDYTATNAEEQIFQRLIAINRKTMRYDVPSLAASMPVISADHLTYDFRIRKGIKWADGKPVTGEDVIFSLKALKDPFSAQAAQRRENVDRIHSAELIDGDPYRVRFTFSRPYVWALQATFGDALYILPKHILDPQHLSDRCFWDALSALPPPSDTMSDIKPNDPLRQFAEWLATPELNRYAHYIQGSGPYKLDTLVLDKYVRLVRNPRYVNHWGPAGVAFPDTLIYKFFTDISAEVTALGHHEIDLIGYLQLPLWHSLDTTDQLKRSTFQMGTLAYIGFNQTNPIFRDPAVRWAMAYAIDRKTIIDKLLYGAATLTQSTISSMHAEYNHDLPEIPFDLDKATHILDSLDWKDHDGDGIRDKEIDGKLVPFKFTFNINSGNEMRMKILLLYVESLRKIGIDADVQAIEWSVYLDRLRDHQTDAHYSAWLSDPYEADNYALYHSSQARDRGANYDSYNSPRADKLMVDIRTTFDDKKRQQLQLELQRVMHDDQAVLCLWEPLNCAAWVDRFDNVSWDAYRPGYDIAKWRVR